MIVNHQNQTEERTVVAGTGGEDEEEAINLLGELASDQSAAGVVNSGNEYAGGENSGDELAGGEQDRWEKYRNDGPRFLSIFTSPWAAMSWV